MKRTFELYGVNPKKFAELPYKDALTLKARLASQQKEKWRKMAFKTQDEDIFNYCFKHYKACDEAYKFNMLLLKEIETGEIEKHLEVL